MKFGRYLRDHSVEEWRRQYINYRILKKAIGKAAVELEGGGQPQVNTTDGAGADDERDDGRRGSRQDRDIELGLGPQGVDGEDEEVGRRASGSQPRPASVKSARAAGRRASAIGSPTLTTGNSTAPTQSDGSNFVSDPSSAGSGGNESEAPTENSRVPITHGNGNSSRGKGSTGPASTRRRMDSFITASGEMNPKRWRPGYPPSLDLVELLKILPPASKRFFTILDNEVERVSAFYGQREDEAVKRFEELSAQWKELQDHKKEFQAFRQREIATPRLLAPIVNRVPGSFQIPGSSAVRRTLASRRGGAEAIDQAADSNSNGGPSSQSAFRHGRPEEYMAAKSKIKLATFEYYRSLGILKSYKVLNTTGITKALKKFEKTTRIPCAKAYKSARLSHANFETSTRLDELIRETEDAFAGVFEHGDRKKALERLREMTNKKMHHFASWRSGVYLGLGLPLLIEGLVKSCLTSTREQIPYWPALLQLFGAMFLPILFALLFFLNMLSWHYGRINFVLIFELDIRTRLDIHQYLEIPSLLFFIYSLLFYGAWSNFWPDEIAPSAYPMTFLVAALGILLFPFPTFYPSARWWSLRSWARVFTAGLVRVEFRDFFLGDELNSLYYCVYNLGFLVCTYSHRWPNDAMSVCSTSSTWATPVLSSVPALLRLGQSIRRYFDSDGLVIHLLNAGKYSASVAYFFAYGAWRVHGSPDNWRKGIFVLFAAINAIYTSAWDITMDWSLLRLHSKNFLLRPELGFFKDKPWVYYIAIVLDIIMRFAWLIYLTPPRDVSTALLGFILALIEVFRRIMWNAFRVESEHIGNVDGYRVTRSIALPYVMPGTSSLRDVADGDDDTDDGRTQKQRIFDFFHKLHASVARDFAPIVNLRLPAFVSSREARKKEDDDCRKQGHHVGGRRGPSKAGDNGDSSSPASEEDLDDFDEDDVTDDDVDELDGDLEQGQREAMEIQNIGAKGQVEVTLDEHEGAEMDKTK